MQAQMNRLEATIQMLMAENMRKDAEIAMLTEQLKNSGIQSSYC